jgi:hypothetical protein
LRLGFLQLDRDVPCGFRNDQQRVLHRPFHNPTGRETPCIGIFRLVAYASDLLANVKQPDPEGIRDH